MMIAYSRRHARPFTLICTVSFILVLQQLVSKYYDNLHRFNPIQSELRLVDHDEFDNAHWNSVQSNALLLLLKAININFVDLKATQTIYESKHLDIVLQDPRDLDKLLHKYHGASLFSRKDLSVANNRIVYLNMILVNELDAIVALNHSSYYNAIDADIDRRRLLGQQTNLKLSEFHEMGAIGLGGKLCSSFYGADLDVVIMVITKPDDFRIRSTIRDTWGRRFKQSSNTRLYFCFGRSASNATNKSYSGAFLDALVRREDEQFMDIIHFHFHDGYTRLTIKSLAMLRWLALYCPRVKHVFKVDTDTILNYDNLMNFIQEKKQANVSRYEIYGHIWKRAKVVRDQSNKFFTSMHDHASPTYPDYAGSSWLLSGEALPLMLLEVAIKHAMPALLWEDLYVSGVCIHKLALAGFPIQRLRMSGYVLAPTEPMGPCLYHQNIVLAQLALPVSRDRWHELSSPRAKQSCCFLFK